MQTLRSKLFRRGIVLVVIFAVLPNTVSACQAVPPPSVCAQFLRSEVVFAGRVELVEPDFGPFGLSGPTRAEIMRLRSYDDSPEAAKKLKDIYSEFTPERYRAALSRAKTKADVEKVWSTIRDEGPRIRFRVQAVFKGPRQATIDVWTDSVCGPFLLTGETYLIYASRDDQGRLQLGGRTQRLTDAGADLAYLHFVQHGGASGRLYGLITSNEADLTKIPRVWWEVPNPVTNVVLQLESNGKRWYATTDAAGEYAFDGLVRGDYTLSVLPFDFPENQQPLVQPRRVTMADRGCVAAELYVPKSAIQQR